MRAASNLLVTAAVAAAASMVAGPSPGEPGPAPDPQVRRREVAAPDLVPTALKFVVVRHETWGPDEKPCQHYDVRPVVKNEGTANAGPFTVRLERFMQGSWQLGCLSCSYDLAGLGKGKETVVNGPEANNCGPSPVVQWRVIVDYGNAVTERNEHNNIRERTYLYLKRMPMRPRR